jgi:hypothetical protein
MIAGQLPEHTRIELGVLSVNEPDTPIRTKVVLNISVLPNYRFGLLALLDADVCWLTEETPQFLASGPKPNARSCLH